MNNQVKNITLNDYRFKADFSNLDEIRSSIFNDAISIGFDEDSASKISLAVDEACTNLIRYSFNLDSNYIINITTQFDSKNLIVKIMDQGNPFNPIEVNEPNMVEYFHSFKKGGLGIMIMKKFMDRIIYTPRDKNNSLNTLTLVKSLSILN